MISDERETTMDRWSQIKLGASHVLSCPVHCWSVWVDQRRQSASSSENLSQVNLGESGGGQAVQDLQFPKQAKRRSEKHTWEIKNKVKGTHGLQKNAELEI